MIHILDRKFSSLPHRKKKPSKPVTRSVSDASQKKPKRGSIFSIFSKRSDPNLSTSAIESPRTAKPSGKPVGRSKSDVGYNSSQTHHNSNLPNKSQTIDRKRIKIPDDDELIAKAKKKSQLSPIDENPPAEKFFGFTPDERKLLRYSKSEEKTLAPALEPMLSDDDYDYEKKSMHPHTKSISPTIPKHSRSLESLQSSQDKLPLTKGVTVDGMVKRLSMDRFSPPLHFNSPAFSYTRPSDPSIVYAQVRRDETSDKSKDFPSTIHRSTNVMMRERSPARNWLRSDVVDSVSPTRQTLSTKFLNEKNKEMHNNHDNLYRNSPLHFNGDRFATEIIHRPMLNNEEDEGVGFEDRKRFHDDYLTPTRDISRQSSSEPPIIPTLRPSYGSIEHLANRRKLLESKINDRAHEFGRDANMKSKLITPQQYHSKIQIDDNEHEINGIRSFDERFPERQPIVPPPRKQWAKQPKYYPETDLNDEFLRDVDTLRREQERLRHKNYLDRKFNEILPAKDDRIIDLGYIDQYNDAKSMNNNNSKIINQNLNYKYRTKGRAPQPEKLVNGGTHTHIIPIEMERRKLDKADSGIEHDFRRDRDILHGDNRSRYVCLCVLCSLYTDASLLPMFVDHVNIACSSYFL